MTAVDTATALDAVVVVILRVGLNPHWAVADTDCASAAQVLVQFQPQEANPVEK